MVRAERRPFQIVLPQKRFTLVVRGILCYAQIRYGSWHTEEGKAAHHEATDVFDPCGGSTRPVADKLRRQ